jgi:hypothetical protein
MKANDDIIEVQHRYTHFERLHRLLCIEKPGCIVPAIPPKSAQIKIAHVDSPEVQLRLRLLQSFL